MALKKNIPVNTTANETYATAADAAVMEARAPFGKNRHVYIVDTDPSGNRIIVSHYIGDGVSKLADLTDMMAGGGGGGGATDAQIKNAMIAALTPTEYTALFPSDPPKNLSQALRAAGIVAGFYDASAMSQNDLFSDLNDDIKAS